MISILLYMINNPKIKIDLPEESKAKRCGSVKG
jgi:hypothetical protein